MESPITSCTNNDAKIYPETLYYAKRVSQGGGQPVFKRLMPDGDPERLSPNPSLKLRDHSPDGFQWSYCGSGPAQLALALLLDATTDPEVAQEYYQDFKFDKVATWGESWQITRSEILLWIQFTKDQRFQAEKN